MQKKMGRNITIYAIEDQVYYKLLENNNPATARAYENYKAVQAFKRVENTTDKDVFGLLNKFKCSSSLMKIPIKMLLLYPHNVI